MATDDKQLAKPTRVQTHLTGDGNGDTPPTPVTLQRAATLPTEDQALWSAIRNRTDAIGFNRYAAFINRLLCADTDQGPATCGDTGASRSGSAEQQHAPSISQLRQDMLNRPSIHGSDAFQLLKIATQAFLLFESGLVINPPRNSVTGKYETPDPAHPGKYIPIDESLTDVPGEASRLGRSVTFDELQAELEQYLSREIGTIGGRGAPYLKRIVNALIPPELRAQRLPYCEAILRNRATCPSMIELIWSYWHEVGALVQAMNVIALRFQNKRRGMRDPLVALEIDPLRPLNNLMWGFIQSEYDRLTVSRRVHEYLHAYGLTLYGKAVADLSPADTRSKFIEAFHNLLHRSAVFYQEDADTTIVSDGFPLLNALKEVHLLLAEGAHNQFGDLPWVARGEMLSMQWLLARPEMREFLRGRAMVPYREPWMGQLDTMKRLQGWTDVSANHFRDLADFGEKIVLSVRYGDWIDVNDQEQARNWARYWKPEIQSYLHAYLAATGVDLAADVTDSRRAGDRYVQPALHLRNRMATQRPAPMLPSTTQAEMLTAETFDYVHAPAPRRKLSYSRDE